MKKYTNTGSKDTRSGFGAGMTELGQKNENVVGLCADLIGSLKFDEFKKNHPERFFQIGIAEAPVGGVLQGILYQNAWTVAALLAIRFLAFFSNRSNRRVALKALYDAFTERSATRRQWVG